MRRLVRLALVFALLGEAAGGAAETIKLATLAPEGTVWTRVLRRGAREMRKRTDGAVTLKIYPGGVAGDEADVVRKMRVGQLQAAGMTGFGLSEIFPDIHVLELPLLFRDGREVDAVLQQTFDFFADRFVEKGFRLLGLTETGFVYFYSSIPVRSLEDYRRPELKAWTWEGDRIPAVLFSELGVHAIPLSVPDVLTGLQTGMINMVNGPPAGIVALQWHTKVNYMTPVPYWWTSGGIVLSESCWERLSKRHREILAEVLAEVAGELRSQARSENERAYEALQSRGIELLPEFADRGREELEAVAGRVREALVGQLFSQEVLDEVESAIRQVRGSGKSP